MKPYKCSRGHRFETDDIESYFPQCPTCGSTSYPRKEDDDDDFVQSTVLEDLATIDSILAETSVTIPDAGGFSGFGGGDSGGGGASDSFDGGGGDVSI